jgi:hypothetical protein
MSEHPEALRLADELDAELRRLSAENEALREANEAFGKRQEWWTERMFGLEQQRDALLEALVSFTKSSYIRHQHPKRFAAAVAAIAQATGEQL